MTAFKASLCFFLAPSFDKRPLQFQMGESPGSDLVPFDNYRKFTVSFFPPNPSLTSKEQLIFTAGERVGIGQGRQNRLRKRKKTGNAEGRLQRWNSKGQDHREENLKDVSVIFNSITLLVD